MANVVREMDPKAVMWEVEMGRDLATDDVVSDGLPPFFVSRFRCHILRVTTRHCHTRSLSMYARGISNTR